MRLFITLEVFYYAVFKVQAASRERSLSSLPCPHPAPQRGETGSAQDRSPARHLRMTCQNRAKQHGDDAALPALVEASGLEPLTPSVQRKCSPN